MYRYILSIIVILLLAIGSASVVAADDSDCFSCHNDVRHGLTGNNSCVNCHYNTSVVDGEHSEDISSPVYMHDGFDWEGDDQAEAGEAPLNESCRVCHINIMEHTISPENVNICEDCHLDGGKFYTNPPSSKYREDIEEFIPKVYSHYPLSDLIDVQRQSDDIPGVFASSCFGYNAETGEGTCHGVTYGFRDSAGGYSAHNYNYTDELVSSDPYHWNSKTDLMPDTSDCGFCHLQNDPVVRKAWGDAGPINSTACTDTENSDCWSCHVLGGEEPISFHSNNVVEFAENENIGGRETLVILVAFSLIIGLGFIGYLLYRRSKNSQS